MAKIYRTRQTKEERAEMCEAALIRATERESSGNDQLVIDGFAARGIAATPRVDVFVFDAWIALGRCVRKGEHGVQGIVWVGKKDKDGKRTNKAFPRKVYMFHVSQTDPIEERATHPRPNCQRPADPEQAIWNDMSQIQEEAQAVEQHRLFA